MFLAVYTIHLFTYVYCSLRISVIEPSGRGTGTDYEGGGYTVGMAHSTVRSVAASCSEKGDSSCGFGCGGFNLTSVSTLSKRLDTLAQAPRR